MSTKRLPHRNKSIERVGYCPPAPYAFDVEILSMWELRKRAPAADLHRAHRIEFHEIICVTHGECAHVVDFTPVACKPGSLLVLRPSQTEQFDVTNDWDGWLVLFRPEFLPPAGRGDPDLKLVGVLADLPAHLALDEGEFQVIRQVMTRMHTDSRIDAPAAEVHALLRYQLSTLLIRLGMAHRRLELARHTLPSELRHFQRFQQLVERSYATWHQVTMYAHALGCTEKTLTRATVAVAGTTAKSFIASRISLEAKRMLAHTSLSVEMIGSNLGFEDPSNFVKFFKREAGCTPAAFRRDHQVPQNASS